MDTADEEETGRMIQLGLVGEQQGNEGKRTIMAICRLVTHDQFSICSVKGYVVIVCVSIIRHRIERLEPVIDAFVGRCVGCHVEGIVLLYVVA